MWQAVRQIQAEQGHFLCERLVPRGAALQREAIEDGEEEEESEGEERKKRRGWPEPRVQFLSDSHSCVSRSPAGPPSEQRPVGAAPTPTFFKCMVFTFTFPLIILLNLYSTTYMRVGRRRFDLTPHPPGLWVQALLLGARRPHGARRSPAQDRSPELLLPSVIPRPPACVQPPGPLSDLGRSGEQSVQPLVLPWVFFSSGWGWGVAPTVLRLSVCGAPPIYLSFVLEASGARPQVSETMLVTGHGWG